MGQARFKKALDRSPRSQMMPPLKEGEVQQPELSPSDIGTITSIKPGHDVVFEGRGHLLRDNTFHSGYFKNGRREGPGQLIILGGTGACYNGFWREGEIQGVGTLCTQSGYQYIGEWLDSQQHGKGEELWPDGTKYQGYFAYGLRSGRGEYSVSKTNSTQVKQVDRYLGEFVNGLFEGFGSLEYSNGDIYVGYWKAGLMHGKGKYAWADGSYFQGDYLQGKRHGTALKLVFA